MATLPLCFYSFFFFGFGFGSTSAYSALMVVGGYYHENGQDVFLNSVEVLGKHNSCEVAPLPEPRIGLSVARLKRTVVACGGFYLYERWDCFTYFPRLGRWVQNFDLNGTSVFHSAVGEGNRLYVAGGRKYSEEVVGDVAQIYQDGFWRYSDRAWRYHARRKTWVELPPLDRGIADACLLALGGDLILIGGSKGRYQHADDPSKVWVLKSGADSWNDTLIPPLSSPRMWQSCLVTNVGHEVGIMVAGGYYNGLATMFYPLDQYLNGGSGGAGGWRWLGSLPAERQWGPALGTVDGQVTIAGGKNYGDATLDVYSAETDSWTPSSDRTLIHKREFSSHVTVPTRWFPDCGF